MTRFLMKPVTGEGHCSHFTDGVTKSGVVSGLSQQSGDLDTGRAL